MKFYSDSQHLCPVSRGIPVNTLAASLHSWHSSYILARCFLIVATYYKHHNKQTNELAPVGAKSSSAVVGLMTLLRG